MGKFKTVWTDRAKAQLKQIHDYLKYEKMTPQGATNVKRDLIEASKGVNMPEMGVSITEISNLTYCPIFGGNYTGFAKGKTLRKASGCYR